MDDRGVACKRASGVSERRGKAGDDAHGRALHGMAWQRMARCMCILNDERELAGFLFLGRNHGDGVSLGLKIVR